MDLYAAAIVVYLVCGVVYFALRDQKKHDAGYASRARARLAVDKEVEHFTYTLTEERLGRGPTCL